MDKISEILDEFELPRAPSIGRGVFYHVAHRDQLPEIVEKGLTPAWYKTERNFPHLPIMDDVVYVWPTLGAAVAYMLDDRQELGKGNHVILRLEGITAERLLPDHEEFTRLLDEPESYQGKVEDFIHELGYSSEAYHNTGFEDAIEIINELDPETNTALAHVLANAGDAVGILGIVEPANLHVLELNELELVYERFERAHPRDPGTDWDMEDEDARHELFEEWCYEHDITRIVTMEDLHEQAQLIEPSMLVHEDINPSFFSSLPISQWHALQMPQFASLDEATIRVDIPSEEALDLRQL